MNRVFPEFIEISDQLAHQSQNSNDETIMANNATRIKGAAIQDSMDTYTNSLGQVLGNIVILVDLRRNESLW
jgi:hypothetical protein